MMSSYIIFDGECGFCNRITMVIAKNDKNNKFKFVSSFSNFGKNLLAKFQIKGLEQSTIILIEQEEFYIKSIAIRKILLKIPYCKIAGYFIFLIPRKIADCLYDVVSKYRKQIMKNDTCKIPTLEIRKKFIM